MYTTSQAARILGISERRVRALARDGVLAAEKQGRDWLIDEAAVEARRDNPVAAGRPAAAEMQGAFAFTLMNGEREVCDAVVDRRSGMVLKAEQIDARYAPPGACPRPGTLNRHYLTGWLQERMPQVARPDFKDLLLGKGYADAGEYLFENLALTLSDQYWLRPQGSGLAWGDVNLFSNRYTDQANPQARGRDGYSPSTGGAQAKWWEQESDMRRSLVKVGLRDSLAERAATLMYERLLEPGDYVPYELVRRDGKLCSRCPGFIGQGQELVSMAHVVQCYGTGVAGDYAAYAALCEELGVGDVRGKLAKMLACDYIMANRDRHSSNLGLVRDSDMLEFTGVAPIFDNGQGFFRSAVKARDFEGRFFYIANPFLEMPERQLGLVEDWSWFDAGALEGYPQEVAALFAEHGALDEEAAQAMAALLERRIARVDEYAQEARLVARSR